LEPDYARLAQKYDTSGMYAAYASWPQKLLESYESIAVSDSIGPSMRVAFAAVGGSASAPEVIAEWIGGQRPLVMPLVRGAGLPPYLDRTWTLVCVSARGNTEEVLLLARQASRRGSRVIGISSGGRLEESCRKEGWAHIKIPFEHSPRASFPYLLNGCLKALESMKILSGVLPSLQETAEVWREIIRRGGMDGSRSSPPHQVAAHVHGKLAACYTSTSCLAVARRFKNSMNENAKVPVLINSLPEAAHNEMEAVISSVDIAPILLSLPSDSKDSQQIMRAVEAMLNERRVKYLSIAPRGRSSPPGGEQLVGLLELLYELELASYYCALLRRVDPYPVPASTSYRAHLGQLTSLDP
jgi:glucose/mannose-6-phosphate isomerase